MVSQSRWPMESLRLLIQSLWLVEGGKPEGSRCVVGYAVAVDGYGKALVCDALGSTQALRKKRMWLDE